MTDTDKSPNTSDLISVTEAAKIAGFTREHASLLARTGKLEAVRLGRYWYTTREAVEKYLAEGHRPGPKSRR